jgi:hypothetical protein
LLSEPPIEPGAGVVLPVRPDGPLPMVEALLVVVGDGSVVTLRPIDPLLPVEPLLFLISVTAELRLAESLPEEELPVLLPPVELLSGNFLLVSTMIISYRKSQIKHPVWMRFKGELLLPATKFGRIQMKGLGTSKETP